MDPDLTEVELPDEHEQVTNELNAPKVQRNEWDNLRDWLAQTQ